MEIKQYSVLNYNKTYQNLQDSDEVKLRGKCVALNGYIRKAILIPSPTV